jgi:hypothetical protein
VLTCWWRCSVAMMNFVWRCVRVLPSKALICSGSILRGVYLWKSSQHGKLAVVSKAKEFWSVAVLNTSKAHDSKHKDIVKSWPRMNEWTFWLHEYKQSGNRESVAKRTDEAFSLYECKERLFSDFLRHVRSLKVRRTFVQKTKTHFRWDTYKVVVLRSTQWGESLHKIHHCTASFLMKLFRNSIRQLQLPFNKRKTWRLMSRYSQAETTGEKMNPELVDFALACRHANFDWGAWFPQNE